MQNRLPLVAGIALSLSTLAPAPVWADATLPTVEITTSKLPEPAASTPAMISVVSGEELRARGVYDLRTALSLVAGVDIAPGGDAGPAGSVPGLWGLREFDAFLLVIDGVPAGGVFNPALTTLDLNNVSRIEVLRGAAPVMYGATSFVGLIQVIHYGPGETPSHASVGLGTRSTATASVSSNLADWGAFKQSISADAETREFSQDRSQVQRAHLLYRNTAELDLGKVHFDLDATTLHQEPYSPHPREGGILSPRFPLDANANSLDAKQDESRIQLNAGLDRQLGIGEWVTTLSFAHTNGNNVRGFLREDFADDGITHNADGFSQHVQKTDVYFDSFIATHPMETVTLTFGLDWIYGRGRENSDNFEYGVLPDGSNAPRASALEIDEATQLKDRRNFGGAYVQADWKPAERWDLIAGLRFNRTAETRAGEVIDEHADPGTAPESSSDSKNKSRLSGVVGVSYALWERDADRLTAFADYRNTYKPAAIDFGPEAEGDILKPETANSREAGLKGRFMDGRFEWEASVFHMNFANLVIAENIDGLPALANAGTERFKGAELEGSYRLCDDFRISATYAYHNAQFVDYERLRPDGSLQQLGGNRLELSPQNLAAIGFIYAPAKGLNGSLVWNRVGSRFLNKGNTSVAGAYNTVVAGIGYRFNGWELRLDGYNLSDRRDPVAESELGDAQFYRLSGRSMLLSVGFNL